MLFSKIVKVSSLCKKKKGTEKAKGIRWKFKKIEKYPYS